LTAEEVLPAVSQAETAHLANAPFAIDDPKGFNLPLGVATRDLWHRFYENQMQIAGGKNDRFAAFADSGGLVMGHYANTRLPLWGVARQYVLADNFFMGAFGGSFLNHFMLICACAPTYPNAEQSSAKGSISAVEADGVTLKPDVDAPKSALEGWRNLSMTGISLPIFMRSTRCNRPTSRASTSRRPAAILPTLIPATRPLCRRRRNRRSAT
jgi:acid phosphatase